MSVIRWPNPSFCDYFYTFLLAFPHRVPIQCLTNVAKDQAF